MTEPRRPLHDTYVVCVPGLEPLVAAELAELGVKRVQRGRGGVSCALTTRQLYAANLWLRTATRVVVRVAEFRATTFSELELAGRHEVPWEDWLPADVPVQFRVTATGSLLYHTDAIAERLATAAGRAQGEGPLIVVRNVHNRMTVSIDASGEPLHRRGWRQAVAKAPLRESLAAAMLAAVGWTGAESGPLLDPFCGSGTIAIEAALRARNRPPGVARSFALFDWPGFEPGTWASVSGQAAQGERRHAGVAIVGADRDAGAIEAATGNAARAGVTSDIEWRHAAISDLTPPAEGSPPGWLLSNPPYGERVAGAGDLRNLYARLGDVARERLPGWRVGLLVADRALAGHTRLGLSSVLTTSNGGIPVSLLTSPARR